MGPAEFDDPGFLARLRQGDSAAYRILVRRFHASLVRFAASIIGSHALAEEVVQDTWLAVYAGVGKFEGRSSLVTWIFSIVANRARTRVSREGRLVGLGSLMEGTSPTERGVPLTEFKPDGHWVEVPRLWDELNPERIVGGRQLWDHVQAVIELLPAGQRAVILLRDMEGRDAEETCALLEISAENQRVLLHRARSRIRQEIDRLVGVEPVRRTTPARMSRTRGNLARVFPGLASLINAAMMVRLFPHPDRHQGNLDQWNHGQWNHGQWNHGQTARPLADKLNRRWARAMWISFAF
jgi:RNA polymerase sigma-70 factor (ECF subfamily)